jgi:lauroyl/myristoyl acyltransferase
MNPANAVKVSFLCSVRHLIPYLPLSVTTLLAKAATAVCRRSEQVDVIKVQLEKLFGDAKSQAELEQIAVESICNNRKDLFEIWSFPRLSEKRISKFAYIEGREHLDSALRKGKGALIAVSHFGSWKMVIAALGYAKYKVNQIGVDPRDFIDANRPDHHNAIMDIEHRCDQSLPVKFIYIGKFLREAYRALARNEVVINSMDGFLGAKCVEVPFLKGVNRLSLGPLVMAVRSSAAFLPTFAVRQADNRYKITIHEEIKVDRDIPEEQAVKKALDDYLKVFEDYVSRYPSHYCRTLYDRAVDSHRIAAVKVQKGIGSPDRSINLN